MPARDPAEELAATYGQMSDDELLAVGADYDSLSANAQILLRDEFARRSMDAPEIREPSKYGYRNLVTLRRFQGLMEALTAKSVLDAAGIFCYLRDENTIRMGGGWASPLLTGGLRLEVAPGDMEAAGEILAQPIPPVITQENLPDYQQPTCPRCNSLDISPVPIQSHAWKCHACSALWVEDSPCE